jgi:hypothetical protein
VKRSCAAHAPRAPRDERLELPRGLDSWEPARPRRGRRSLRARRGAAASQRLRPASSNRHEHVPPRFCPLGLVSIRARVGDEHMSSAWAKAVSACGRFAVDVDRCFRRAARSRQDRRRRGASGRNVGADRACRRPARGPEGLLQTRPRVDGRAAAGCALMLSFGQGWNGRSASTWLARQHPSWEADLWGLIWRASQNSLGPVYGFPSIGRPTVGLAGPFSEKPTFRQMVRRAGSPAMLAPATSSSARPPETGVRAPLRRGRRQCPRFPGERVRDTSCEACESQL